jgi:hypothetical protein
VRHMQRRGPGTGTGTGTAVHMVKHLTGARHSERSRSSPAPTCASSSYTGTHLVAADEGAQPENGSGHHLRGFAVKHALGVQHKHRHLLVAAGKSPHKRPAPHPNALRGESRRPHDQRAHTQHSTAMKPSTRAQSGRCTGCLSVIAMGRTVVWRSRPDRQMNPGACASAGTRTHIHSTNYLEASQCSNSLTPPPPPPPPPPQQQPPSPPSAPFHTERRGNSRCRHTSHPALPPQRNHTRASVPDRR